MDESAMLAILGGLVNVQELCIFSLSTVLTCRVLARLTPQEDVGVQDTPQAGQTLCRKLTSLELRMVGGDVQTWEARISSVLALIEGRAAHGIQRIQITDDCWAIVRPKVRIAEIRSGRKGFIARRRGKDLIRWRQTTSCCSVILEAASY